MPKSKLKIPCFALVKWHPAHKVTKASKLKKSSVYMFLGELPNMPLHCAVVDVRTGKVLVGYHTDGFRKLSRDEV